MMLVTSSAIVVARVSTAGPRIAGAVRRRDQPMVAASARGRVMVLRTSLHEEHLGSLVGTTGPLGDFTPGRIPFLKLLLLLLL